MSIYNPGNAAAVPVSHSVAIIYCCPEQCDRYSTQTILWEQTRHSASVNEKQKKKQLKCCHQNNFLPVILVAFTSLMRWGLCASPHYRSVLTASLVSAASGSNSHQPSTTTYVWAPQGLHLSAIRQVRCHLSHTRHTKSKHKRPKKCIRVPDFTREVR